jgi:hypothetical protein
MTLRYAVGIKIGNRADQMTVEVEDALIAALKVKTAHPEAAITYVRKRNARGDRRHPHSSQIDENPAAWAGFAAFRRDLPTARPLTIAAYAACLAGAVLGSLYLWPSLPDNWIHVEEEREGLGMITAALALALVGIAWWHRRHWQPNAAR